MHEYLRDNPIHLVIGDDDVNYGISDDAVDNDGTLTTPVVFGVPEAADGTVTISNSKHLTQATYEMWLVPASGEFFTAPGVTATLDGNITFDFNGTVVETKYDGGLLYLVLRLHNSNDIYINGTEQSVVAGVNLDDDGDIEVSGVYGIVAVYDYVLPVDRIFKHWIDGQGRSLEEAAAGFNASIITPTDDYRNIVFTRLFGEGQGGRYNLALSLPPEATSVKFDWNGDAVVTIDNEPVVRGVEYAPGEDYVVFSEGAFSDLSVTAYADDTLNSNHPRTVTVTSTADREYALLARNPRAGATGVELAAGDTIGTILFWGDGGSVTGATTSRLYTGWGPAWADVNSGAALTLTGRVQQIVTFPTVLSTQDRNLIINSLWGNQTTIIDGDAVEISDGTPILLEGDWGITTLD
jgi:hypothetical protein